jgi:hypothetical protein
MKEPAETPNRLLLHRGHGGVPVVSNRYIELAVFEFARLRSHLTRSAELPIPFGGWPPALILASGRSSTGF